MSFFAGLTLLRDLLWRGPLLALLPAAGLLLSWKLGLIQLRRLPEALRLLAAREEDGGAGEVSPFAALCTALSATIGTGNIVGVATAVGILAGGPGALFWMWLSAFFGMAVKYAEGFLAVRFRVTMPDGSARGGPFYYMERGLSRPGLGKAFALCTALAGVLGIGTMTQMSGIAEAAELFLDPAGADAVLLFGNSYTRVRILCGLAVGICATLVILGGAQRIARTATLVVPLMAGLYIGSTGLILLTHAGEIPGAVRLVLESAFGVRAAVGGGGAAMLLAMQHGVARGVFSNEAGLGSAPIAAGSARTKDPVRQGLITMTGTLIDTLILCTMTGLTLIVMGSWRDTSLEGVAMTLDAFERGLWFLPPGVSDGLLAISLTAFAFTTILGWCFYGERSIEYLTRGRAPGLVRAYRVAYLATVFAAPYIRAAVVWTMADVLNAMMALPNLIALFGLADLVARETRRSALRRRRGSAPHGVPRRGGVLRGRRQGSALHPRFFCKKIE